MSLYQAYPGNAHWQVVKMVFRYLKGTTKIKLCFGLDDLDITGYIDADFASDVDDRKSTNGYVFLFDGTPISWLSKKQNCVAKDIIEV